MQERRSKLATHSLRYFFTHAGEVAKWLRQRFAKPSGPKGSRGFESHLLRQAASVILHKPTRLCLGGLSLLRGAIRWTGVREA